MRMRLADTAAAAAAAVAAAAAESRTAVVFEYWQEVVVHSVDWKMSCWTFSLFAFSFLPFLQFKIQN